MDGSRPSPSDSTHQDGYIQTDLPEYQTPALVYCLETIRALWHDLQANVCRTGQQDERLQGVCDNLRALEESLRETAQDIQQERRRQHRLDKDLRAELEGFKVRHKGTERTLREVQGQIDKLIAMALDDQIARMGDMEVVGWQLSQLDLGLEQMSDSVRANPVDLRARRVDSTPTRNPTISDAAQHRQYECTGTVDWAQYLDEELTALAKIVATNEVMHVELFQNLGKKLLQEVGQRRESEKDIKTLECRISEHQRTLDDFGASLTRTSIQLDEYDNYHKHLVSRIEEEASTRRRLISQIEDKVATLQGELGKHKDDWQHTAQSYFHQLDALRNEYQAIMATAQAQTSAHIQQENFKPLLGLLDHIFAGKTKSGISDAIVTLDQHSTEAIRLTQEITEKGFRGEARTVLLERIERIEGHLANFHDRLPKATSDEPKSLSPGPPSSTSGPMVQISCNGVPPYSSQNATEGAEAPSEGSTPALQACGMASPRGNAERRGSRPPHEQRQRHHRFDEIGPPQQGVRRCQYRLEGGLCPEKKYQEFGPTEEEQPWRCAIHASIRLL
ncbi:MAG: hypothetical protein Q9201_000862 [Fulgogasparrea decipioides]